MGEGKGEEMTQTLYASMNKTKNKKSFKNKKKKTSWHILIIIALGR
jgi:hypothetical protein